MCLNRGREQETEEGLVVMVRKENGEKEEHKETEAEWEKRSNRKNEQEGGKKRI